MAQVIETVFSIRTEESIANLNEVVGALGRTEAAAKKTSKSVSDEMEKIPVRTQKAVSGFNGLANSINQVSRELPAFAFSAQTGFLAISNNIPILVDEINNLRKANAALAAEGKATVPVFQQLAMGILSWQTAMSLAISFSVLYAKEIGNLITELMKGKMQFDEASESIRLYYEAFKGTEVQTAIQDIERLRINVNLAQEGFLTKESVLKEYNETIGKTTGKLKDLSDVEDFLVKGADAYIKMTLYKTAANMALQEAAKSALEAQIEAATSMDVTLIEAKYAESLRIVRANVKDKKELAKEEADIERLKQAEIAKFIAKADFDSSRRQKQQTDIAQKFMADAAKISKEFGFNFFDGNKDKGIKKYKDEWEKLKQAISDTESLIASQKIKGIDTTKTEAAFELLKKKGKEIQDYLDELSGEAEKRRVKAFEEDNASNEKLLKQTIDNELAANKEKFSQIRNSKKLTNFELLQLSNQELEAEIAILERFREANNETNNKLISDKDKAAKGILDITEYIDKKNKEARDKATETELLELETKYANLRQGKIFNNEEDRKLEIEKQKGIITIIKSAYDLDLTYAKQLQQEKNKLKLMENKDLEATTKEALNKELLANDVFFETLKVGKEENAAALQAIETDRLNKNLEILEKYKQKGLEVDKEILDSNTKLGKNKIDNAKREAKERKDIERELRDGLFSLAKTLSDDLFKYSKNNLDAETSIQLEALDKQKEAKLISEEEFQTKRKQILNQQAQTQRELDLAQIKVNTALAVIKTFALLGFTPKGFIAAGLAAAEGVAAYAIAQSQPLPRFAKGTDRVKGGIAGQDSVHALLMPNEAVIPAKANMERQGLAKAWISGDLDKHLAMNYINPAINEVNRKWEMSLKLNQQSTFIRNDNFSDRKIVGELIKSNRINKHIANSLNEKTVKPNNKRLWS
jgi:hypothetical protein